MWLNECLIQITNRCVPNCALKTRLPTEEQVGLQKLQFICPRLLSLMQKDWIRQTLSVFTHIYPPSGFCVNLRAAGIIRGHSDKCEHLPLLWKDFGLTIISGDTQTNPKTCCFCSGYRGGPHWLTELTTRHWPTLRSFCESQAHCVVKLGTKACVASWCGLWQCGVIKRYFN